MADVLIRAISWFSDIIIFALLARAIASWFVHDASSQVAGIYGLIITVTEPIVAPIRRFMSRFNTGMLDFSVLIAFFVVKAIARILIMAVNFIF